MPNSGLNPTFPIFAALQIIRYTEQFRILLPTVVTIGTFDGVHLGHQKILKRLAEVKQQSGLTTAVLTFEPHPRKVLFPEQKDLRLITTTDEKLEMLEHYGVDLVVVYPFSKHFSQMDPQLYISEILKKSLNVKHLVIGYDHKFGKGRTGTIQTLRDASAAHHFSVEEIDAEDIDKIAVSSTRIRKALEEGHIGLASEFLGHPFMLTGKVVKGKQLGRTIGYPTANLHIPDPDKLIPRNGIYFVEAWIGRQRHHGMMSIGYNPTTDNDNSIKLEVHFFNFNDDIYSREVRIRFVRRLRDEKKFAGIEELKHALDADMAECLHLIEKFS